MKLTNLSLAIMVALGVAACGGSDDNNSNKPADPSTPPAPAPDNNKPQPQPETKNDDKIVDPTGTNVVDGRDLSKESTVGGLQYIRRDGSDYDRVYNPDKMASATPLLGVSLDEQNPKLTNIVLARRDLEREADKAVRAQFAGGIEKEPLTHEGKAPATPSLQVENFKNVDILAGAFKQVGSADFSKADNRLGADHNIDTHIQNNTDKDGEFTRERVEYVYTPRFEYRQPFVDYPNAKADNLTKESDSDTALTPSTDEEARPLPPGLPGRAALQEELKNVNPVGKGYWTDEKANISSRHPVNTGTGKDGVFGGFLNHERLYGNMNSGTDSSPDDAANSADATAWRNKGTRYSNAQPNSVPPIMGSASGQVRVDRTGDVYYDPTKVNAKTDSVVNWNNAYQGTVERTTSVGPAPLPANYKSSKTYDYRNSYTAGAYPDYPYPMFGYPYTEYNEEDNDTLTPGKEPNKHEHIYLEREKFTAIREPKYIRPLVNPVANEWTWTLAQEWKINYTVKRERYTPTYDNNGHRNGKSATPYSTDYDLGDAETGIQGDNKAPQSAMDGKISAKLGTAFSGAGGCDGDLVVCTYDKADRELVWAYWKDPVNQGGGQRGEFRGPFYIGWDQDNNTVQFSDTRIWKAGSPGYKAEYEKKYGANLIWWSTQDSAFENWATSQGLDPRARRVDRNVSGKGGEGSEDLVWGNQPDGMQASGKDARDRDVEIQPTGDITNGLIRIGNIPNNEFRKMPTLGQELKWDTQAGVWKDHHKTSTRIFGHYHLAYADQDKREVKDMSMNSYLGARSFVAKVKDMIPNASAPVQSPWGYVPDLDSAPVKYSIGAEPMTLHKVQYGRVTSNLDLASGEGPLGDGFLRAPFGKKGTGDTVDNYFFRGVDATSIEDMAKLPQEGSATYNGHALMYGINNDYHGITGDVNVTPPKKDLPNAFDGRSQHLGNGSTARYGLGNFVEANVDFATRKVKGDVYNAWLVDEAKSTVVHDKLVAFEGDITGNTVIGKADRTYIPGNDEATFRAAFFGSKAEEMGGAFNSVKPDDKYGSAYEVGDWGGVFGAKKTGSGGNTFQGDDSNNLYGNTNVAPANNYNE